MSILASFRMSWQESMKALFCRRAKVQPGLALDGVSMDVLLGVVHGCARHNGTHLFGYFDYSFISFIFPMMFEPPGGCHDHSLSHPFVADG